MEAYMLHSSKLYNFNDNIITFNKFSIYNYKK